MGRSLRVLLWPSSHQYQPVQRVFYVAGLGEAAILLPGQLCAKYEARFFVLRSFLSTQENGTHACL